MDAKPRTEITFHQHGDSEPVRWAVEMSTLEVQGRSVPVLAVLLGGHADVLPDIALRFYDNNVAAARALAKAILAHTEAEGEVRPTVLDPSCYCGSQCDLIDGVDWKCPDCGAVYEARCDRCGEPDACSVAMVEALGRVEAQGLCPGCYAAAGDEGVIK